QFKPYPELWPVQLGEIMHNLRSSLDHLIFEISAPDAESNTLKGTEFPIFLQQTHYELPVSHRTGGQYKIRGIVNPEIRTLIDRWQPFHFEDPPRHYLWLLQELSNADKHRALNVITSTHVEINVGWSPVRELKGEQIE